MSYLKAFLFVLGAIVVYLTITMLASWLLPDSVLDGLSGLAVVGVIVYFTVTIGRDWKRKDAR